MRTYLLIDNQNRAIGTVQANSLDDAFAQGQAIDSRTYTVRKPMPDEQSAPTDWIPEEEFQANVNILNEVLRERKRQHAKFGQQNHTPPVFATILNEEVGEVNIEVCQWTFANSHDEQALINDRLRNELIQLAAVAVQMVACIDRMKPQRTLSDAAGIQNTGQR